MRPDEVWESGRGPNDTVICRVCRGRLEFVTGADAYFHYSDFHSSGARPEPASEARFRAERALYPYPHALPGQGARALPPEKQEGLVDRGNGLGED